MKKIKLKDYKVWNTVYNNENFLSEPWEWEHEENADIGNYIMNLLKQNGYDCDLKTAIELWSRHSNSMDSSWLCLYRKDEHNLDSVMEFIDG